MCLVVVGIGLLPHSIHPGGELRATHLGIVPGNPWLLNFTSSKDIGRSQSVASHELVICQPNVLDLIQAGLHSLLHFGNLLGTGLLAEHLGQEPHQLKVHGTGDAGVVVLPLQVFVHLGASFQLRRVDRVRDAAGGVLQVPERGG